MFFFNFYTIINIRYRKNSIKYQATYSVTKKNKYVVLYTTQEKYILNSVLIKDNKLIFTNKTQLIVDCNDVKLTKKIQ